MGIALYSPKLDKSFNSVRAIQFTKNLVENFHFHQFDPIRSRTKNVQDSQDKSETDQLIINLLAAAKNDVATLMSSYLEHFDMNMSGYDGKTALHVAATHGHLGSNHFRNLWSFFNHQRIFYSNSIKTLLPF